MFGKPRDIHDTDMLDTSVLEDFSLSHVAARAELRALVGALKLPGWAA